MAEQVEICCCCRCDIRLKEEQHYINFRYQVPGEGIPEQVLVAVVCTQCAKDADDPLKFPLIELLTNTMIIRIEKPDKTFTP